MHVRRKRRRLGNARKSLRCVVTPSLLMECDFDSTVERRETKEI